MGSSGSEPKVTGTVDMAQPYVADPQSESPIARKFVAVLERVCELAPVRVSLERSRSGPDSPWTVSRLSREGDSAPEELLTIPSNQVRTLLAYVGNAPMRGQLYGGYMHRVVQIGAKRYRGIFYMSNDGFAGFWLRLYLFALDHPTTADSEHTG